VPLLRQRSMGHRPSRAWVSTKGKRASPSISRRNGCAIPGARHYRAFHRTFRVMSLNSWRRCCACGI